MNLSMGQFFQKFHTPISVTKVVTLSCPCFLQLHERACRQTVYGGYVQVLHNSWFIHSNIRRYITFVAGEVHLNNPVTIQKASEGQNTSLATCPCCSRLLAHCSGKADGSVSRRTDASSPGQWGGPLLKFQYRRAHLHNSLQQIGCIWFNAGCSKFWI
jgi:hypothetical protein